MFQYFNKSYFNNNSDVNASTSGYGIFGDSSPSLMTSSVPSYGEKVFFMEEDNGDAAYSRSKRVVSLIIDRYDEKIKAMATPISVWNQMTEYNKNNDFVIWREGHGLQTRYFVEALGLSEVSKEQQKSVSAILDSYTFADIFVKKEWEIVSEVVEKIESRWQILDFS